MLSHHYYVVDIGPYRAYIDLLIIYVEQYVDIRYIDLSQHDPQAAAT